MHCHGIGVLNLRGQSSNIFPCDLYVEKISGNTTSAMVQREKEGSPSESIFLLDMPMAIFLAGRRPDTSAL